MAHSRLPRFRRSNHIRPLELTARDLEILRRVHQHRFLRSAHVVSLLGGSRQHILRRLQLLFHHGYLERPRAQLDFFHRGGSRAFVYGLGPRGCELLKRDPILPIERAKAPSSKGEVGRLFLDHALLISDLMVCLEVTSRRHGQLRLLRGNELVRSKAARGKNAEFRWQVRVRGRFQCGVVPDQVFALEDSAGDRVVFFLEADRGTMPVRRRGLAQSSFVRKLLAYEETWAQKIHRTRFEIPRFRVLTVTNSAARVQTLVEACRDLEKGRGLFLFSDAQSFLNAPDPFLAPLDSARPQGRETLLESLSPEQPLLKC